MRISEENSRIERLDGQVKYLLLSNRVISKKLLAN